MLLWIWFRYRRPIGKQVHGCYTALGDTYFLNREYEKAKSNLYNARNCPDGISNPFILLRLRESLFECGELDKAREYLIRAYILEGYKLFLMRMISI